MFKFEWDYRKAESNVQKHGVSIEEAVSVFTDAMALTFTDSDHSETEHRSRTYGIQTRGGCSRWFTPSERTMSESIARERQLDMKKRSTSKDDQDIPEYKREQLGVGVRGKHYKQFMQGSNVVVLQPEIQKAFPTSEAVNNKS